ncbi:MULTISPECIES: GNAT family N-acetyltransferase [Nocardiopsidaceae]|uniref:GNAT family N-acetyltransferase n=1 Tax=Streptomonospora nanhaiensis TaxID=1323731 RepID=A0ABY6YV05_9ACTN|nr:GNAT family N-acetyltransferase [Streptomonospora nanhaiensis]WAE76219.1 GNAT family N-acetyltransferase [Streptomonospora nanhaiensis]
MRSLVEVLDPSTAPHADLAAWASVYADGQSEVSGSAPEPEALVRQLLRTPAGEAWRWSARAEPGDPVQGVAELRRQPHDVRLGFLRLFVDRAARRRGLGRALREAAAAEARSLGVVGLQSTVLAGPPGEPFANSSPYLRTLLRLELQRQYLDEETLRRCWGVASRPRPGYRLTHWLDEAPDALAASFGRVLDHVLDSPGAILQTGARSWGADQVREWERRMTDDGSRLVVGAALDRTTDEVVAATVSTVTRGPVADQHDTAVLPGHRRRGLASRVKATQALRVHDLFPHVEAMAVTINRENAPMLAVNRSLGYQRVSERLLVEESLVHEG